MKTIFILFMGLILVSPFAVYGNTKHEGHDHEASIARNHKGEILIKVKGMVCAFCAQGIKKNFGKRDEVKATKVDLDKMEVKVSLKKGKSLSEKVIKSLVTDAGFSFDGVKK